MILVQLVPRVRKEMLVPLAHKVMLVHKDHKVQLAPQVLMEQPALKVQSVLKV